ncbi:MAG: DUF1080 domain-containing protein [Rhodothermales bacterium]
MAVAALLLATAGCGGPESDPDPDREDWVRLFDGRSLSGWNGDRDLVDVDDGLLRFLPGTPADGIAPDPGRFLAHDGEWSFYRLRLEYRFPETDLDPASWPERDVRRASVWVHSTEGANGENVGMEVELLGGDGENDRPTGNACTPGTQMDMSGRAVGRECVSSASETHHGDEWVTLEVTVLGAERVEHRVDGVRVLAYERPRMDDGTLLAGGGIAIRSGGWPFDIRRIDLLPLRGCTDPQAVNRKSYYVSSDPRACLD